MTDFLHVAGHHSAMLYGVCLTKVPTFTMVSDVVVIEYDAYPRRFLRCSAPLTA
jgi:hypothetical protein